MCERKLETEQNCNILTPPLIAISVSLPFSWAAQPGAWGPASLGAGFLYRILSPTRLIPKLSVGGLRTPSAECWLSLPHLVTNWSVLQNSIGGPEGPFCWVLFSLQHHFSNSSDPQNSIGGPEGPFCWVLAFSTTSCLQKL